MSAPAPLAYTVMLKSRGMADYRMAGRLPLATAPLRGQALAVERDGTTVRGTIDAVFIPPGCEENCVGTVFVSEG